MSVPPAQILFSAPELKELAPCFPGYDFEILIATGGMGAVYRAIQKSLERTVAIKILPQEFSKDAAFCAGFEAEAKAMARLNHPNLIGVYDFGEIHGMPYIIMEYVPGKSLFHSAHGIAIEPSEVIRLLTGICSGLAHAHQNGIIHRDIKPSNILLDLNAQPKIGDFGLARPIERKIQEGEEIFGTPHYTAPEVVQSPESVDNRADIFSVGVLLHELLTGRLPADDTRPASTISHCDPRFDAIIRKATHPLPSARYSCASKIATDLQAIAASAGPRVLRTTAPATASRSPRPQVRPIASASNSSSSPVIVILVVAIVIVGIIVVVVANRDASPAGATQPFQPPAPTSPPIPKPAPPKPVPVTDWKPRPTPQPEPEPRPEPRPEPEREPEPEPEPDKSASGTKPVIEPLPDPPVASPDADEPAFDVPDFLGRARTIMQDRATPLIAARDEALVKNLNAYERDINRLIHRIDSRDLRSRAEEQFEQFLEACRTAGARLPDQIPNGFRDRNAFLDKHKEFLKKQQDIDSLLILELSKLAPLFVLGIEKQIERLDPVRDEDAIEALKEEIQNTRTKAEHFPNLILGIDPEAEDGEKNEDDGDEDEDE